MRGFSHLPSSSSGGHLVLLRPSEAPSCPFTSDLLRLSLSLLTLPSSSGLASDLFGSPVIFCVRGCPLPSVTWQVASASLSRPVSASGLLDDGAWSAMEVEPSALLLLFFSGDGRVRRFLFSGFLLFRS
ncbi:hypothetical protein Bca52824_059665 [Brassica carinata]|uniref:Uncharacterized protein n=1 Tax=Brassica carinata TaxID=52824 RepID=A0A8X7UEX0_BRACI|nr:hypothetical protein Bca52824_059665 [Brassica carinata]